MPSIADIRSLEKEASGQVSTLTRSLALGFLAIAWSLLTAHDEPLRSMAANVNRYLILAVAAASVVFLFCDLLQYVAIKQMAHDSAEKAKNINPPAAEYDKKSIAYRTQIAMYLAKLWVIAAAALLLLVIFISLLLPLPPPVRKSEPSKPADNPAKTAAPPAGGS